MTDKTKRIILIAAGVLLCAALVVGIVSRLAAVPMPIDIVPLIIHISKSGDVDLPSIIGAAASRLRGLWLYLSLLRFVGGRRFLVAVRFRHIIRRMVLFRLAGMLRRVRFGGRTLNGLLCAGAVSIPAGIMLFTIRLAIPLYLWIADIHNRIFRVGCIVRDGGVDGHATSRSRLR